MGPGDVLSICTVCILVSTEAPNISPADSERGFWPRPVSLWLNYRVQKDCGWSAWCCALIALNQPFCMATQSESLWLSFSLPVNPSKHREHVQSSRNTSNWSGLISLDSAVFTQKFTTFSPQDKPCPALPYNYQGTTPKNKNKNIMCVCECIYEYI